MRCGWHLLSWDLGLNADRQSSMCYPLRTLCSFAGAWIPDCVSFEVMALSALLRTGQHGAPEMLINLSRLPRYLPTELPGNDSHVNRWLVITRVALHLMSIIIHSNHELLYTFWLSVIGTLVWNLFIS